MAKTELDMQCGNNILSLMQPTYFPWLGYFNLIKQSDVFVVYTTTQLQKRSWQIRNKIKTSQGTTWLTIPLKLKGHTSKLIQDVLIDNSQQWKKKHLKRCFYSPLFNFS